MLNSIFDFLVKHYLHFRYRKISKDVSNAVEVQEGLRKWLITFASKTEYGKLYNFDKINSLSDFKSFVPLVNYEELVPFIDKTIVGEKDVLWPGITKWFAKSSGTTTGRSKYIPVTDDFLKRNMVNSSWDSVSFIYNKKKNPRLFADKTLLMGGSITSFDQNQNAKQGDVSAIMISAMPPAGRPFFTPDYKTAVMENWEEKIEAIAQQCIHQNVVMFGGVPSWINVLFNRMLEITGKKNMLEIWPNAHTYMHGGVGFGPYRKQFESFFPSSDFKYWEVYNASEGYIGMSNDPDEEGMLLLINNAIYYEFILLSDYHNENKNTLNLSEVELDLDYVIVLSTSAGLWRYVPGDTIKFVSLNPFKIKVTGRVQHFINVFGEELIVGNAEEALKHCCQKLDVSILNYTVGPHFTSNKTKGRHDWLIEFKKAPENLEQFKNMLDNRLRELNSDYDAKRFKDMVLLELEIINLPSNTFYNWLKNNGKLGGQNKVPRLSNDRGLIESILSSI